jgi:lysophospholipase L1-like esterase
MKVMHKILLIFTGLLLLSFQKKTITLFMAGDSTMSIKAADKRPETGWGMPFATMFDETVKVDKRAANGRSTKSFVSEGKWKGIIDNVKEGDYVFIQFGHNDQPKEKKSHTTPEEYKTNLENFVTEVRNKNGIPVLLTPVARRKFDKDGKLVDTHFEYPDLVRLVAKEKKVLLIDMLKKTEKLLIQLGKEESVKLYNHLDSAQHVNYPKGVKDDTHLNEYGAKLFADLAIEGIKELNIELYKRVN